MHKLANKTAVVTGAGSGIGKGIALRLAAEGARVIVFECDSENGQQVVNEILKDGGDGELRTVDVSSLASVRDGVKSLRIVDILVNNAGISSIGNLEDTNPEEMDLVYGVNVKGVYHCLSEIVPGMKERGSGVILNVASIASRLGIEDRFAYSTSKGAVLAMTLSVARDYVAHGIRCNCICPSRVHTPLVDAYLKKHYLGQEKEMFEKLSNYQPIGRMARIDEVANLAVFLCSDEASFITGATYEIDGGVTNLR